MRFGVVILPESSWPEGQRLWRRAEELGFTHAWTYDHIAWGSLRDAPWFASLLTLTAAATVTERIRLGPLVASPNFRHPVPFARELITLDDISDGRLTLGIGAGGTGWDTTVLGQRSWLPGERAARFAEFVELLDRLLRATATSYEGRYYAADNAPMRPGCVQQPRLPFAIAATGPRAMRLAARHADIWVTNGDRAHQGPPLDASAGVAVVQAQLARLEQACHAEDRDPASIDRLVLAGPRLDGGLSSVEAFRDTVAHYEQAGITDFVVHWPRANHPYAADPVIFEHIFSS